MTTKEYLNVSEISKKCNMTARNVRKIITKLKVVKNENLLHKNQLDEWQIRHLLLPEFKRKRIKRDRYFALTIDPYYNYTPSEIDTIMSFIFSCNGAIEDNLEINYVIEQKKSNNQNHIHCYIKTNQKRKLMQCVKESFCKTSYHESDVFDLEGWKNYITKDGNPITTLIN